MYFTKKSNKTICFLDHKMSTPQAMKEDLTRAIQMRTSRTMIIGVVCGVTLFILLLLAAVVATILKARKEKQEMLERESKIQELSDEQFS